MDAFVIHHDLPMTSYRSKNEEKAAVEALASNEEPPIGPALFHVMRVTMFDEKPIVGLDALPLAQLRLLWTVHYFGAATMKDFSERLGVSQSTVTQLADRLVKRGLIDRQSDLIDRRVVRLNVSAAGREILDSAESARRDTIRKIWLALTPEAQIDVMRGLDTLWQAAEVVRAQEGRCLSLCAQRADQPVRNARGIEENGQSQPVVDLMALRVRGRTGTS